MENLIRKTILFIIFVLTFCFSVHYALRDINVTINHRIEGTNQYDGGKIKLQHELTLRTGYLSPIEINLGSK
jgi:hypothetical protein